MQVPRADGRLAGLLSPIPFAVFVSGVASMGLEILAGRMLAPSFGSGIYVWGSIIGVFLAALALGYWVAGKRAARAASREGLALALLGAAGYVVFLLYLGDSVVTYSADLPIPARYGSLVPITVLFGPPTVMLGFVSPYGAELIEAESTGDASGQVYALGTGGSIIGAFATTFVLVPGLDVASIELVFGLSLVVAAVVVAPRSRSQWTTAGVIAAALVVSFFLAGAAPIAGSGDTVYETQTAHQDLRVADDGDVRTLWLDGVRHSAMYRDDPDRYVFEYTRYFHVPMLLQEDPDRVLFVGGGGFSGPKRFLLEYPDLAVDVVEIDPAVVRTARQYFDVPRSDRLSVHVGDGRVYVDQTDHTYDVAVLDAYRADEVPYQLTTVEFMEQLSSRLDEDGVVVANVISAPSGPNGAFYRAQYRTMDAVFPQVYSFPTSPTSSVQNIMLVATKNDTRLSEADLQALDDRRDVGIDLSGPLSNYRADVDVEDAPLLRDDYAPVDSLLARQVDTEYVVERTDGNATRATPRGTAASGSPAGTASP